MNFKIILFFLVILVVAFSSVVKSQAYNGRVLVLKGRVFFDSNQNTALDQNESGFGGIDLIPLDNAVNNLGQLIQPTKTSANGEYAFDGLMERVTYRFNISNPQGFLFEDYDISLSCPSGKTCIRDASPSEGYKGTIVIENLSGFQTPMIYNSAAARNVSQVCLKIYIDLGPPPTQTPSNPGIGVVGNFFTDSNSNGLKENNETWYAGLQLMLLDANGNVTRDASGNLVSISNTNANGRFQFENVLPGNYTLKIVGGLNTSMVFNPNTIGPFIVNSTTLSSSSDGVSSSYFQNLGQYGLTPKGNAICSGKIYYDFNWNLLYDGSDKPYPGVIVNIYDAVYGNLLYSVLSDNNGNWIVYGLVPGTNYTCNFIFNFNTTSTGTPPSQCIQGGQTNINCGLDTAQNVTNNPTNDTVPLGFYTSCFVIGAYNGDYRESYTVVRIANNASGYAARPAPGGAQYITKIAKHKDTGSINGITYRPETGDVYVASYFKSGTGFGPSGQGAIYRIQNGTNTVSTYVDLLQIFGNDFTGPLNVHNLSSVVDELRLSKIYCSKVSLGDMDSTATHLYVSNLFTNEIIQIPLNQVPTASNIQRINVPNGGCTFDSDWHIFAVKVFRGKMFVGGVCNGESGNNQLDGIIRTFNGSNWETILQFPFGYRERGDNIRFVQWSTTLNKPQPIVSQLAFVDNGDVAIGIRDRYGDLTAQNTPYPDIYLACTNKNGDYEFEENGKCGGRTALPNYGSGFFPGGKKFLDTTGTRQTNVGVGVARAGPSQIVATGVDVISAYEGGVTFINTNNGSRYNRYQIYSQVDPGNFGKASGLGAITPIDLPAPRQPLECGRIWFDCNGNGIQDCNEVGIPNIQVYLYDQSNLSAPIATASSDATGNFKFTTEPGKKYSCLIQSSEVQNKFGSFALSPLLNEPKLEYIDSDAVLLNGNLIAGFNGTSFGAHIFTDCHFGIVKANEVYQDGYGTKFTNGTCQIPMPPDKCKWVCPGITKLD